MSRVYAVAVRGVEATRGRGSGFWVLGSASEPVPVEKGKKKIGGRNAAARQRRKQKQKGCEVQMQAQAVENRKRTARVGHGWHGWALDGTWDMDREVARRGCLTADCHPLLLPLRCGTAEGRRRLAGTMAVGGKCNARRFETEPASHWRFPSTAYLPRYLTYLFLHTPQRGINRAECAVSPKVQPRQSRWSWVSAGQSGASVVGWAEKVPCAPRRPWRC